jgi:NADH pyrophosphatase NudC (nudix superfamily)
MTDLLDIINDFCNYSSLQSKNIYQSKEAYSPISNFKFCPHCGQKTITKNDEKSIRCTNCEFIFYTNPSAAVCATIIQDNKVLFTIRNKNPHINKLDLPGGFVDLNETAEHALIRELKEELNVDVVDYKYITSIPNIYPFKSITYNTVDMFFLCRISSLKTISLDDEIAGYKLLSLDDFCIDKDIGLPSIKSFFNLLKHESI